LTPKLFSQEMVGPTEEAKVVITSGSVKPRVFTIPDQLPVARCLRDQLRVEIVPGIGGKMRLEVVGDLRVAFHAQERFGPAGVAAALFLDGPLKDGDARTRLQCRRRCR
jgi:hypothetical protein